MVAIAQYVCSAEEHCVVEGQSNGAVDREPALQSLQSLFLRWFNLFLAFGEETRFPQTSRTASTWIKIERIRNHENFSAFLVRGSRF